ncbi:MAG: ATP-binding protein [Desulfuromusa sp.]|nr:ATP-binding protein [Desulfuromusa sp.]
MHLSFRLKNRLPSWNLLFLALVLGGGVFFWHTTRQQQLLDQLDRQLQSTARDIDFFYDKTSTGKSAQNFLCTNLTGIPALATTVSNISVYSAQGEMLCFAEKFADGGRVPFQKKIHPDESASMQTDVDSQGYLRSITYPISRNGQPTLYLSISSDLSGIKKQSLLFTSILFLLGTFILTSFAVLQRKLRSQNLTVIKQLTSLMDQTNTELRPLTFHVAETAGPEIQKLACSYNEMMTRRANNLRRARQFTADVTHELRTPLTILRGETELALRNGRDQKQLRQVLVSNLEEISRMSYLIEDLLLLSKGDLGEIPLKMEPLHLNELMTELHHQAQLLATAKNIKVELHHPQQQILLQADSLRLRQVFLNLLTNAIKYTPNDGTVSIALTIDAKNVATTITDTGIGMDGKHLDSIFNRFYRVDKTGNRNDGGSGLGLAIVKWIVDAHHGSVKVSSSPGQGSIFTVVFPLLQNKTEDAATPSQKNPDLKTA